MHIFIKHAQAWIAAVLAAPFILLIAVVSCLSLLVFALAMALVKIPQFLFWSVGPHARTGAELRRYHNPLSRLLQRVVGAADWPNR